MNYNELKENTNKKWKVLKKLDRVVRDLRESDHHLSYLVDTNAVDELYNKTYKETLLLRKEDKYREIGYDRTISFRELQKINLRKNYSFDVLEYTYNEILRKLNHLIFEDFGGYDFEVTVRLEVDTRIIGMVTLSGHGIHSCIDDMDNIKVIPNTAFKLNNESTWYMYTDNTFAKVDKERLINNISVLRLML